MMIFDLCALCAMANGSHAHSTPLLLSPFLFAYIFFDPSASSKWANCSKISNWMLSINEMQSAYHCLCFPYFVFSIRNWLQNWFRHKTGWHNTHKNFQWIWQGGNITGLALTCSPSLSLAHATHRWEITLRAPIIRNSFENAPRTRLELQIAAFIFLDERR